MDGLESGPRCRQPYRAGDAAGGLATDVADGRLIEQPHRDELAEAARELRVHRPRRERRDDLDLAGTFEGRLARPSGVRFGERDQRPNAVVVAMLIARSPFELVERLDREIAFARRQLRLTELEHQ